MTTKFPYGYCGMPCALCSRNRTDGSSRCPGCSHDGYYTDVCKVHHCCRDKQIEHCGKCSDFPCVRLGKMGDFKDLNTGHVKQRTCREIAEKGFEAWYGDYAKRAELLTEALEKYNNGRMKRFLCELFIQHDFSALEKLMKEADDKIGNIDDIKQRGKAFKLLAEASENYEMMTGADEANMLKSEEK